MASEDSDEVSPGLLSIHRLGDPKDVDQTLAGQVMSFRDHPHAQCETVEVDRLRTAERVGLEERNDPLQKVCPPPNHKTMQVLTMVVVPAIDQHVPHSEELTELLEASKAPRALHNCELVSHLEAGSVAAPPRPALLADEADREASFSVYKTNNPA
jgi:hypothetical protein